MKIQLKGPDGVRHVLSIDKQDISFDEFVRIVSEKTGVSKPGGNLLCVKSSCILFYSLK